MPTGAYNLKILISSIVYRPEPTGYRAHDLAAGLVELGHDVVAMTGLPSYPFGRVYDSYRVRPWQWENHSGVRVLRLPYVMNRSRSALQRVLSYTFFSVATTLAGVFQAWRPDVMWTNQVGLPGVLLSSLRGFPFVHEVQDLWPEWTETADLGMKAWLYNILDRQQKMVYHRAAALTVISEGFRHWLVQKGAPAGKIKVIPNWADSKHFHPVPRDQHLGTREGLAGQFNVMYAGNVGVAQALDVILDTSELLKDLPDVRFVIIGDGLERERLERKALERELDNVRFLGSRLPEELADYLAWADVLLIHLKRDPKYEITIPSKTYSYLACGRPILVATRGDVADLIQEFDAGLVVPPEEPTALATAVRELHAMPAHERERYGQRAAQAFVEHFDRRTLVRRYEEVFSSVVNSK